MIRSTFGTTAMGQEVDRITLSNALVSLSVLTYGATLQDVRLGGLERPLTLGSWNLADYEGGALLYFGAVVGPVANRIANAHTWFDGRELAFAANAAGGHTLHGGETGLHDKVWEIWEMAPERLVLTTTAADGEGGYPGNRRFYAEFALGPGAGFTLRLRAETDAPTLVNLANHSYWNLGDGPGFDGHTLQIAADRVQEVDENALPTGRILDVEGTPFDFREPRALTAEDHLDNNFCLADYRRPVTPACILRSPDGVSLHIATSESGLQVYDARGMPEPGVTGLDGKLYGPRSGLAIEAQSWPDAPSNPGFPSIRLDPGAPWEQETRFTFTRLL